MITKKNTKPNYWNAAIRHLSAADPVISRVISKYKHNNFLTVTNTPFVTLFKIILGQQISIEAAKSIENRIKKNIRQITPNNFLKHDNEGPCMLAYDKGWLSDERRCCQ